MMKTALRITLCALLILSTNSAWAQQKPLQHDAEHYILLRQHAPTWSQEDRQVDAKLAEVRANNNGRPPNIVYILLDDLGFGEIGMPSPGDQSLGQVNVCVDEAEEQPATMS